MASQFDLDLRQVHIRFKFHEGDRLVVFVGDDEKSVAATILPSDVSVLRDFFASWKGTIKIEIRGISKITKE